MNNKGQFSIIAALFVSVILITTVIITYSTVRNSLVQNQPQFLSAIDETNLAIKQILGFTVGYYGSVLQVTGNSSHAKMLATKYLQSGLENIANMHPEWGTSFKINNPNEDLEIRTYWFTNSSYSMGKLKISYNFTALGMYGLIYETSCRLDTHIEDTLPIDQTQIMVTKDEGEPLINLGKQNFKFYCYNYTNSTWELINPSIEPLAFANGTYLIDIPSGVDSDSYVIQVEDQRGIIVVASSFSRYTCTLAWNSTLYAATGATNSTLINQESFEGSWPPSGWSETGRWNKESDRASTGTYSADFDGQDPGESGNLTTFDLNCYGANSIYVDFWYRDEGCDVGEFSLQYYDGTTWNNIDDLGATTPENQWLPYNQVITDTRYFKSNFRIRWYANDIENNEHAYVDYVTVTVNKQEIPMTIVVELLQNGTMRWLGQQIRLTTQVKPIPPIPVKSIHVNQTMDSVNQEVPFQIEDWASDYKIPLGLTSNASVFSSRTMLVFLVNSKVSKVTIWWNGSDTATQTPYAYIKNPNFSVNPSPSQRTLTNGILNLKIDYSSPPGGVASFKVISTLGTATSTAEFMRINTKVADWGWSEPTYAIMNGTVRVVVHHEIEWGSGGVPSCPNVYAHIVLTLPANATYYTYQLRFMFVESQQDRTISDLCPIKLTTSISSPSLQTENGISSGFPIVQSGTGTFYNSSSVWQHHWSQFISGTKGAGIMFTDDANKILYIFDNSTSKTGALKVDTQTIELLPIKMSSVSFTSAKDVTWYGAVVTFDATTPIYKEEGSTGLWIIVEYPPTITVQTEN